MHGFLNNMDIECSKKNCLECDQNREYSEVTLLKLFYFNAVRSCIAI